MCCDPSLELILTLLHSEWPKLYGVLAILSAIGLMNAHNHFISSEGITTYFHRGVRKVTVDIFSKTYLHICFVDNTNF